MKTRRFSMAGLLIITVILIHCTRNPVGDNKIKPKNLTVTGAVQLSDATLPEDVFVWLEGFNLSTITDSTGRFRLQLPSPETQPGGGVSGMFKIFYYVANYKFAVSIVAIVDGSFVYGEKAVDKNGRISRQILKKLVDIETNVTPTIFPMDSAGYLRISVAFRNPTEPINITAFHKPSTGELASIVIKRIGDPIQEAQLILTSIWPMTQTIDRDSDWTMSLFSREALLTAGTYELYPYIFIEQKDLPDELLRSIGMGYDKWRWHPDYLKIPLKLKTAVLIITDRRMVNIH